MTATVAVVAADMKAHWKAHKRALRRLVEDAPQTIDEISPWQMAFFALFAERFDGTIALWLGATLQAEATAENALL